MLAAGLLGVNGDKLGDRLVLADLSGRAPPAHALAEEHVVRLRPDSRVRVLVEAGRAGHAACPAGL